MPSITDFLNQQTRTVNRIVDETFWRLTQNQDGLDGLIPTTSYLTRELFLLKMQHSKPTIANVYAEEQEIYNSRTRMTLNTELISNCKVGKQYTWKGMDFVEMDRLQSVAFKSYDGTDAVRLAIENYFFGRAADLIPAIDNRALLMAINVLLNGSSTFTDPLTNAQYSLTYANTSPALLLPPLTGTARWTQPTTANALLDIESHGQAYYNRFGYFPVEMRLRYQMIRDIANQDTTRTAIAQKTGYPVATGSAAPAYYFVEDQIVTDMISARLRGAKVNLFDSAYSEEDALGNVVDKYYLPANTYFFAEPGLIEKAYVPTVEKDFAPGVFTLAEVVSKLPRVERVAAVANIIPFVTDARKLASRQVSDLTPNLIVVP